MTALQFLELQDFRNYVNLKLQLHPGSTLVTGKNGSGKTNLIEAIGFLARGSPLRNISAEGLIRVGAEQAIIRGEFVTGGRSERQAESGKRSLLVEAQLPRPPKRLRLQVNRQLVPRRSDLRSLVRITAFLPDHLSVVQGGPEGRRDFLDEAAAIISPAAAEAQTDLQHILRQRNALLRQAKGVLTSEDSMALSVWDEQLATTAAVCTDWRHRALQQAIGYVVSAYQQVAGERVDVEMHYEMSWRGENFLQALDAARRNDLRRGLTTIGPHRDDLQVRLGNLLARTHASQGEQRTLALAMRLALHQMQTDIHREAPLLLLDDVLSELDIQRSERLIEALPAGQAIVTSATPLPEVAEPDDTLVISEGTLAPIPKSELSPS